mmetsp:Transcript_105179/g.234726  ORF Transcript_105179/g.234726 Transcript_105179/m.234726 type:complete len:427 (-) Transcript_105179:179-1459(-)
MDSDMVRPFIIPVAGLVIGTGMMMTERYKSVKDVGKLVLYFGAQSFMNVYMSWLMRKCVVLPAGSMGKSGVLKEDLTGIPGAFALTALQQMISFVMFVVYFGAVYFTPYRYNLKPLPSLFDKFTVILFGLVFCANIALNNFSLSLISIAVNLIIRSCLPLTTYLSQQGLATCKLFPLKPFRCLEVTLMCIGVSCAGIFTWADAQAAGKDSEDSKNLMLGVIVCVLSLLCGSMNLALAGVLGTSVHLNPLDTVAYMAVPATCFLAPVIFFLQKPVPGEWGVAFGRDMMSDWEILMGVWELSPYVMSFGILSGVFSFLYNIIQFTIVQTLSPSATAFGGNFNKAALIFLSYLFMDPLPHSIWGVIIMSAIVGNIVAFSAYTYIQIKAKEDAKKEEAKKLVDDDEEDEDEDEDDDDEDDGSDEEQGCCA